MKKLYPSLFLMLPLVFALEAAQAQSWCTPPTGGTGINSYASTSPVITNVTFNTINRSSLSSNKELYVNTGASTTVTKGQSYTMTMTYTQDVSICTTYNLRVWIDWNIDGTFNTSTETAMTINSTTMTTWTGSILIPTTATAGTTRMRIAMKMTAPCGHTNPDPCLVTDGSLGWHGEVEDYTLIIQNSTGINENLNEILGMAIAPNPSTDNTAVNFFLQKSNNVNVEIFNIAGEKVAIISEGQLGTGEHTIYFNPAELNLESGIYFVKLTAGDASVTKRLAVLK